MNTQISQTEKALAQFVICAAVAAAFAFFMPVISLIAIVGAVALGVATYTA